MRDHIHDKTDQQNNYTFNKKNQNFKSATSNCSLLIK